MATRPLKLGTRRSALARAQSNAVARALERHHPGLRVELVGIDTRGDRITDRPLHTVEGKEFFTAEIDAALLRGEIDCTVHSFKDLSLERLERFQLASVPRRAVPNDVVLFSPDAPARLVAGEELVIGSSSPRRASFVPDFLRGALPRSNAGAPPRVRLVELRGNVDSRLRRLREPRGSVRQLDGVVLAFAGLARLWADASTQETVAALLAGSPRMVLPLSASPAAPAQGALAIECRPEDGATARLLAALDDPATRRATDVERALLEQRGGGCHQRFGATQIEVPHLGSLLYLREAHERSGTVELQDTQLHWTPAAPLPTVASTVRPWDGSRARDVEAVPLAAGVTVAAQALTKARAVFVAHRRAWPQREDLRVEAGTAVWVPGVETWRALAERGVWVEGCADGLGWAQIEALLAEPWLRLPRPPQWTVLTHAQAVGEWDGDQAIATYQSRDAGAGPPADATHVYWASGTQFERWRERLGEGVMHACGPGKTGEHLRRAGVSEARMFPSAQQWRQWLRL